MVIRFLFDRPGMTPTVVARAAEVHTSTACRWKAGRAPDTASIFKLYARGLLTEDDLRAGGLPIPRSGGGATDSTPDLTAAPPATRI